jgi:transposase
MPNWDEVHLELHKKGVTLRLLWMEYLEKFPTGYSYSQFCQLYRKWAKKTKPTMRLNHKAGEKMFVDYTGQKMPVIDSKTGEVREAEIFVAVLGASSYTYAEAQWHQDRGVSSSSKSPICFAPTISLSALLSTRLTLKGTTQTGACSLSSSGNSTTLE